MRRGVIPRATIRLLIHIAKKILHSPNFIQLRTIERSVNDGFHEQVAGRGIDVLDPEAAQGAYHVEPDTTPARFLGFCVSVPDLEAVAARLTESEVSFQRGEERLFVPAEEAFGCMVAFEQG